MLKLQFRSLVINNSLPFVTPAPVRVREEIPSVSMGSVSDSGAPGYGLDEMTYEPTPRPELHCDAIINSRMMGLCLTHYVSAVLER